MTNGGRIGSRHVFGVDGFRGIWSLNEIADALRAGVVAPIDKYALEVMLDSPLAYWRFDETSGTVANDSSGNGFHGEYIGSPSLDQPPLIFTGRSVDFSGSGQRVDCPYLGDTGFPLAIEAVFELDAMVHNAGLVTTNDTSSNRAGLSFILYSNGDTEIRIGDGGGSSPSSRKSFVFAAGFALEKRYYVHVIANSMTDVRLFVGELGQNNLVEIGSPVISGGASFMSTSIGFPHIGYSPSTSGYINGRIDEPAIYTADIGDARRQAHYDAAG